MNALHWIDDELRGIAESYLWRQRRTHAGPQGAVLSIDGREVLNFGANDYLGLAADPRLAAAANQAAMREGWGAGASPLIAGHSAAHQRLEKRLAEFEGVEAALLFSSGYAANLAAVSTLARRGDAIFADAKNHASLIDGCRLSRAEVHVYPHNDCVTLAALLREHARRYRRRLIATDSLFSMDGDIAPLAGLADLAAEHDAMLLVDEAHATGVLGEHGRGATELLGVEGRVDIRVGTLSKALGGSGGFIAGSQRLIDYLVNRGRPYIFSTAPPPALAAAATMALDLVEQEPYRRTELLERSDWLRRELRAQGWQLGASATQIIPILIGDPATALALAEKLWRAGFWLPCIRPPSVPAGESLLRISLSYEHTPEMLGRLIATLSEFYRTSDQRIKLLAKKDLT